jgi:hypothetical protein
MAQTRTLTPGYTVIHPNRDKTECKVVKVIVVGILLASVGLMLLVTFGGWSKLEGLTPLNFVWCLAYLVLGYYVWRWSRGSLPIAAGLAILLLMVTVVAGTGLSGTSWFDRSNSGFAHAQSIFGGAVLSADVLGIDAAVDPSSGAFDRLRHDRLRAGMECRARGADRGGKAAWFAARGAAGSALGCVAGTDHR